MFIFLTLVIFRIFLSQLNTLLTFYYCVQVKQDGVRTLGEPLQMFYCLLICVSLSVSLSICLSHFVYVCACVANRLRYCL